MATIEEIAASIADAFKGEYQTLVNDLDSLNERQQQLLSDLANETDEARKEAIRREISDTESRIKSTTDAINRGVASNWDQWTDEEKEAFREESKLREERSKKVQKEVDRVFGRISSNIEEAENQLNHLDGSFVETLDRWSEQLSNLANTLNLSTLVDNTNDAIDSYVQNIREMRAATGSWFDESGFNDSVSDMVEDLASYSRNEASGFMSDFMREYSFKRVDEASNFAEEIAAANKAFGTAISDYENIVKKDRSRNQNGELVLGVNNLIATLQDNEDLYTDATGILSAINENINSIYGIASKDFKRQKGLIKSVAAIEALQQSASNDGLNSFSDKVQEWAVMSIPELYRDEGFVQFQALTGFTAEDFQEYIASGQQEEIFLRLHEALNNIGGDDYRERQYNLDYWANEAGLFDGFAELNQYATMDPKELKRVLAEANKSIVESENFTESGESLSTAKEHETVGWIDDWMNEFTNLPFFTWLSDTFAEYNVTAANLANAFIVGSTFYNILRSIPLIGKGIDALSGKIISSISSMSGSITGSISSLSGAVAGAGAVAAPVLVGTALGGAMIYDSQSAFDSANRNKEEGDEATALAYNASGAGQVAGGATAIAGGVAGGVAAGSALVGGATAGAALLAGASVAAPLIIAGAAIYGVAKLGEAALESMEEVESFSGQINKLSAKQSKAIISEIDAREDSLFDIKETVNSTQGSMEDLNEARQSLIDSGISEEATALLNSKREILDFTQNMINASEAAKSFAESKLDEQAEKLKDDLVANFDDDKKDAYVEKSLETLMKGKSSLDFESGNAEEKAAFRAAQRFLSDMEATISDEDERKAFHEKVQKALEDNELEDDELEDLLKGQDYSALSSRNLDIEKLNKVTAKHLGGDSDLMIDTQRLDEFKSLAKEVAKLEADYNQWKSYKDLEGDANLAVAKQAQSDFQTTIEMLEEKPEWEKFEDRGTYEQYAHDMGIEGYKEGLSYVPNDGLAYLHKGESVLPAVDAKPDGGPDNSSLLAVVLEIRDELVKLTSGVLNRYSEEEKSDKDIRKALEESDWNSLVNNSDSDLLNTIGQGITGSKAGGKAFSKMLSGKGSGGGLMSHLKNMFSNAFSGSGSGGGSLGGSYGGGGFGGGGSGGGGANASFDSSDIKPIQASGENARDIWDFFIANGYTPEATAGIMGNLQQESSLDPTIVQGGGHFSDTIDVGDDRGYGLAQWTYYSRQQALLDYAQSKGKLPSDLLTQLEFIIIESGDGAGVKGMTDVAEATIAWQDNYERPGVPEQEQRIAYAKGFYDQFAKNATSYEQGTPLTPSEQIALIHENEMVVPEGQNPFYALKKGTSDIFNIENIFGVFSSLNSLFGSLDGGINSLVSKLGGLDKLTSGFDLGKIFGGFDLGKIFGNILGGLDLGSIFGKSSNNGLDMGMGIFGKSEHKNMGGIGDIGDIVSNLEGLDKLTSGGFGLDKGIGLFGNSEKTTGIFDGIGDSISGSIEGIFDGITSSIGGSIESLSEIEPVIDRLTTEPIEIVKSQGESFAPKDVNPMNDASNSVNVVTESSSGVDNSSQVVETMKWQVSRLESKLDQLISVVGANSGQGSKNFGTGGTKGGYSPDIDSAFASIRTPGLGVV